ncbi:MAG: hypothetical protein IKU37_04285 [Candidatus Gastranaerophilales bacterium]|nr:hypothetical protein [Candidatus Gastranaerophilales bacterium]
MSDFLNALNKNSKTEKELRAQIEQELANIKETKRKAAIESKLEDKKFLDEFMPDFINEIKNTCVDAVSQACFFKFNNKKYLLCEISLVHEVVPDDPLDPGCLLNKYYMKFFCCKLKKKSIFKDKREHQIVSTRSLFFNQKLCKHITHASTYGKQEHLDLSSYIKNNIDGYTDINFLPKRVVQLNTKSTPNGRPYEKKDDILAQFRFAIEF